MKFLSKRRRPFRPYLCKHCDEHLGIRSTPLLTSDNHGDKIQLHATWESLESSARKGCELCRLLRYTWLTSSEVNDHPYAGSGPLLLKNDLYFGPPELLLTLGDMSLRSYKNSDLGDFLLNECRRRTSLLRH